MQLSVMMMFNGQSTWEMTRRKRDRDTRGRGKKSVQRCESKRVWKKNKNNEKWNRSWGKKQVAVRQGERRGGEEKCVSTETLIKEVRGL